MPMIDALGRECAPEIILAVQSAIIGRPTEDHSRVPVEQLLDDLAQLRPTFSGPSCLGSRTWSVGDSV